jgi:hypothetical protein
MTSSISGTTSLPQVASSSTTARPNEVAASGTGGDFTRLMHLQERARDLEQQIRSKVPKGSTGDPARDAVNQQQLAQANQLEQLRTLVGPTPGSHARHAFAAVLQQGPIKPSDLARVRLAIAVDAGAVTPAAAPSVSSAIARLDAASDTVSATASDPTLTQDPARLTQFQQRMHAVNVAMQSLDAAIAGGRIDAATATRLDAAARQQNPGYAVRDVLAAVGAPTSAQP